MPKTSPAKPVPRKRAKRKTSSNESAPPQTATPHPLTIFTIGHSTRTPDEFLKILRAHGIEQLVDVRTIPKSRRLRHFNKESLAVSLPKAKISYTHLKALGGLRHARKDSPNTGWRNASFRGYADYMGTEDFQQGIERLLELARKKRTAIMCAEAVPWRCHRSLIGDALLVRGVPVEDLMSATAKRPHTLTPFAKVNRMEITYPNSTQDLFAR